MAHRMVKSKLGNFKNFSGPFGRWFAWLLPAFALLTFIGSWLAIFPRSAIENWYARGVFPIVSGLASWFADAIPFSWLDIWILMAIPTILLLVRRRRFRLLANAVAGLYLIFFWSWGLNYHRQPLASKLPFDSARTTAEVVEKLTQRAALEINRLYVVRTTPALRATPPNLGGELEDEIVRRVRRVVTVIDATDWSASSRIKHSFFGNPWFHAAGIDGMFNPLGHEPVVSNSLLDVERPFVMAHELAHVRGYPDEGDANLIALYATVMSNDPAVQYSGWLALWLYLRDRERDKLLDAGPRADLQRIFERARAEQIRWISNIQNAVLDLFLKANSVEEGIRSYAQIVLLAAGTEAHWERFR